MIECLGLQKNIENLNWEIVIVDNNSTDNTKDVSYAFCEGSSLKINYVYEPNVGLSHARNAGILASKGSLLLFIDDDVLVPNEFISNALFGVQEFPEFHIFGFRILPEWQHTKPPFWLSFKKPLSLIQSFIPIHDLGVEPLQYPNRHAKNPIGACFLVKKEVFEKVGPFREDLGAGQSGVCEDTEFFWYSMINKFKILYWPHAAIYHPADQKRINIAYLHKWYFNLGKSLYLVKNKGRIFNLQKKLVLGIEGFIADNLPLLEKILLQAKVFNISVLLYLKLFFLILLQPLTIILFLIKRPFYLTTMLSKTLGETKQAINSY